jgi:ribosomal protein S18 acetylase RimI-like enzyme
VSDEPRDDALLREMAANRGCKLVKSRRRTPGKGDYGRFGLRDAKTGKDVFGFGKDGLTASPEEIETYLRGGALASWKGSVGKTRRKPAQQARREPKPEPRLVLREAKAADADAAAALIAALGYEIGPEDFRSRLAALRKAGEPPLAAEKGSLLGLLTWHVTPVLHRPRPVGRITMLVVAEGARNAGIGTALVAEAEKRLAAKGCAMVEVTSNVKRLRAHGFYERLGYERTSYRFFKSLG